MARRCRPLALMVLLATVPLAAPAEVYRWVDEKGGVHYSDRKPETSGQRVEDVSLPRRSVKPDPELSEQRERGRKLLEVWGEERQQREQEAAAAAEAARRESEQCARLAAHLRSVERARGVYRDRPDGTREYLEAGDRERYEAELREIYANACG